MKKFNKDIKVASYDEVLMWLNNQNATEQNPVLIEKYGGRCKSPFRAYINGYDIVLQSNVQDKTQRKYVLTRIMWNAFDGYVKDHPEMCRKELADNYKAFGCSNKYFWPSIISISKQVLNIK